MKSTSEFLFNKWWIRIVREAEEMRAIRFFFFFFLQGIHGHALQTIDPRECHSAIWTRHAGALITRPVHRQSWSLLLYGNSCSIKNVLDVSLKGKQQDRNGVLGQISYLRSSQATVNLKFSVELKCNRWLCFISPSMKVQFVLFPSHRCFVEICHCLQWVSSWRRLPNKSTRLALGPRCECCPLGLCYNRILNHGRQPSPANWSDRRLEPPTVRETSVWVSESGSSNVATL